MNAEFEFILADKTSDGQTWEWVAVLGFVGTLELEWEGYGGFALSERETERVYQLIARHGVNVDSADELLIKVYNKTIIVSQGGDV